MRTLYEEAGFEASEGQEEIIFAGSVDRLPVPGITPVDGVTVRRQLGPLGTAFNAVLDGEVVGTYEVNDDLTRGGTNLAFSGWADESNPGSETISAGAASEPGWSATAGPGFVWALRSA